MLRRGICLDEFIRRQRPIRRLCDIVINRCAVEFTPPRPLKILRVSQQVSRRHVLNGVFGGREGCAPEELLWNDLI